MRRVLLIEDNPDLAFGLQTSLEVEGYARLAGDDVGRQRAGAGRVEELHDRPPSVSTVAPVPRTDPVDTMPRKLEAASAQVDKRLAKRHLQVRKR